MRKILERILIIIFVIICTMCTLLPVYANEEKQEEVLESEIVGQANQTESVQMTQLAIGGVSTYANILPNELVFYWNTTENSFIIYITNKGLDSVDTVTGLISTGTISKSFTFTNISVGENVYSVTVPIKKCHEDIIIRFWATDGGDSVGSTTSYGSRDIPDNLLNKWAVGGRGTVAACLNYHYAKHGNEVGAYNICAYVRMADYFRNYTIVKEYLKPYKKVIGATPNCYRYRNKYYYIDVVCINGRPSGEIVSFGARN